METLVYRISSVLAGQSATVVVVGRDAAGIELQLELPRARARAMAAGQLLILHVSAHAVPELGNAMTAEAPPADTSAPAAAACGDGDDAEIRRMLGLG